MKKLFVLLVAIITLFSFDEVKAEEVPTITKENSYLIFDMIEDKYFINNNIDRENCYFVVFLRDGHTDAISIYIDDKPFSSNFTSELNVVDNNTKMSFKYNLVDNTLSIQSIYSTAFYDEIYFSNHDILKNNTDLVFSKNFPLEEDIEPEPSPSPSPEPSDKPEIDTSDLEKCNSFVCDISDTILDGFNDDRFPFVKLIIKFLLLLLLIFVIISPFWLLYKFARWLM